MRYRTRLAEVEAFELADGRVLLATDPPRYIEAAAFAAAFEPAPNGKHAPKAGAGRAARTSAKPSRPAHGAGGRAEHPKKTEARRLFEQNGLILKQISTKLKLPYGTVYGWSRKEKWVAGKAPAVHIPVAPAPRSSAAPIEPIGDAGWMK